MDRARHSQGQLFTDSSATSLSTNYKPTCPDFFKVSRIYLAKGSVDSPERRGLIERVCGLYPGVPTEERLDTPHNRIELSEQDTLSLHRAGKHVLVFGELRNAVRFSEERGNACPNYWHFSPYGFCPFDCKYCYLAGTQGVKFSPTVKIYVNLPEMLSKIDGLATRQKGPTAFYLGKLQDPLALDPLTAYSRTMVPFFARHAKARLTLLTKSTNVDLMLDLEHNGHTILSWSVNPPEVSSAFEDNVPSVDDRLDAMRRVAERGYPVRAVMMPIIPIDGWEDAYGAFTERLLQVAPIQRLTLGGICIYRSARELMEKKLGKRNAISARIERRTAADGRARYASSLRADMYSFIIDRAKRIRPDLQLALCLEEKVAWEQAGLRRSLGRCNCRL